MALWKSTTWEGKKQKKLCVMYMPSELNCVTLDKSNIYYQPPKPSVNRLLVSRLSTVGQQVDKWATNSHEGLTNGQQSVDKWSTNGGQLTNSQSTDGLGSNWLL